MSDWADLHAERPIYREPKIKRIRSLIDFEGKWYLIDLKVIFEDDEPADFEIEDIQVWHDQTKRYEKLSAGEFIQDLKKRGLWEKFENEIWEEIEAQI